MQTLKKFEINIFNLINVANAIFVGVAFVDDIPEAGQIVFCNHQNWKIEKQIWVNGKLGFYVKPAITRGD